MSLVRPDPCLPHPSDSRCVQLIVVMTGCDNLSFRGATRNLGKGRNDISHLYIDRVLGRLADGYQVLNVLQGYLTDASDIGNISHSLEGPVLLPVTHDGLGLDLADAGQGH